MYGKTVGGSGAFHGGDAVHEVELGGKVVVEVEEKVGKFFLGVVQGVLFGFVYGGEEAEGVFDGPGEEHESVGFEFGQGDDDVCFVVGSGYFDFVVADGGVKGVLGEVLPFCAGFGAGFKDAAFLGLKVGSVHGGRVSDHDFGSALGLSIFYDGFQKYGMGGDGSFGVVV